MRIKAFYVGPGAERLLKAGKRLAGAAQSPREFDLVAEEGVSMAAVPVPDSAKPAARDYESSFALLQEQGGLEGSPCPCVRRRPQDDDDPPGPSLFRTAVASQRLERITLPGLYIGRSELSDVSFEGSELYRSTLNWSDFVNVDFSTCDLHDSDLQACKFENCNFAGANLEQCDLRGSAFSGCDFTAARLNDARLLEGQRSELTLSPEQQASVAWTEEYEVPPGG